MMRALRESNGRVLLCGASLSLLLVAAACSTPAKSADSSAGKGGSAKLLREIDFTEQPSYIPNDTLSLTFDDGPLPPYTPEVLDVLKQNGVHATFFINTENNGNDVPHTPANQDLIRRIVAEGHGLASHTVHHLSLKTLTPAQIETEITGVDAVVKDIFGEKAPRLTLLRSPYGEPYQDYFNDHSDPAGAAYPMVSSVVSKHAIHVGWNVETDDWKCTTGDAATNANCVYDHFTTAVKTIGAPGAQWGIVLMHCVNPQTAAALPRILAYIKQNGFKLISVEDVVRLKFGVSSAEVVDRR
jgi:peptidoglycan/xylan/chitin deacetylase (PgdA/CDA1 family)